MVKELKTYRGFFVLFVISFLGLIISIISCSSSSKLIKNEKQTKEIEYENNLEALQSFDFNYLTEQKMSFFESGLYHSLKLIAENQLEHAENLLKSLVSNLSDSTEIFIVKKILVDLLFFKNDWKSIINLDTIHNSNFKEENPLILVEAFSELEPEIVKFNNDSTTINYEKSHSGTPILEIKVNGKVRKFWFDTGANYTVIASDVARELNIKPIKLITSKALTATSLKINVLPAVLSEFTIGNVEILNHPAIIADDSDLRFKLFGSDRITKVDGIIGWKAIQNIDITFDDLYSNAVIRKPKIDPTAQNNLFWLGIPFLKIFSEDNIPLIFGLDSGSEKSTITSNIFKKINYDDIYSLTKKISSAGGWTFSESKNISRLSVRIDNKNIDFTDIGTTLTHQKLFIKLDGIIGSDVFYKNKVRIDFLNRRFSIVNND